MCHITLKERKVCEQRHNPALLQKLQVWQSTWSAYRTDHVVHYFPSLRPLEHGHEINACNFYLNYYIFKWFSILGFRSLKHPYTVHVWKYNQRVQRYSWLNMVERAL